MFETLKGTTIYQDELRRNKLCFTCLKPWVIGHKYVKGKSHYIEVFSESEVEDEEEDLPRYA